MLNTVDSLKGYPVVIRPPVLVGEYHWDKLPDQLFIRANTLATKSKCNPLTTEALRMVMDLGDQESLRAVQEKGVTRTEQYLITHEEDGMINRKSLSEDKEKLQQTRDKIQQLKEKYKNRTKSNPRLKTEYEETTKEFEAMLRLFSDLPSQPAIIDQSLFVNDLNRLLDFYLEQRIPA